jgi:pilus assembly protein CpaF
MSFELILPFLRPIEPLLLDESISEIMGNPDASWWYERDGIIRQEKTVSFDAGKLRTGLEVIANQLGKKLDEDNPLLNAQLPDGSRLAAVIPPVVRPSPALTIRKFTSRRYTVDDLIARDTLTRPLAEFLAEQIRSGKTLLISGGTGTGKTTLLRILADFIPECTCARPDRRQGTPCQSGQCAWSPRLAELFSQQSCRSAMSHKGIPA